MTTKFEHSNKKHVVISCSTIRPKLRQQTTYWSIFRHIIARWWLHGCRKPRGYFKDLFGIAHSMNNCYISGQDSHADITLDHCFCQNSRRPGGGWGCKQTYFQAFFLRSASAKTPPRSIFQRSGLHIFRLGTAQMSLGTVHLCSTAPLK